MSELESKLQRKCQKIFKDDNIFVVKTHGDMYVRRGIPDLIACVPVTKETVQKMLDDNWFRDNKIGIFVGLEIKQEGKLNVFDDRRKAQEIVGNEIKNSGGIWFAVDDSDTVLALVKMMRDEI